MYYTYIVTNKNNTVLYIGVTSFLEGRMHDHRERLIEGFTKRYQVTKLIYYEDYPDPMSAIQREKQLKGWICSFSMRQGVASKNSERSFDSAETSSACSG